MTTARYTEVGYLSERNVERLHDTIGGLHCLLDEAWREIGDLKVRIQELSNLTDLPVVVRRPNKGAKWLTPEIELRLGKESDRSIALELKVSESTILKARRRLGIKSEYWEKASHEKTFLWTEEKLALLGTTSDEIVANAIGATKERVRRKRYELGIASLNSTRGKQ